MSQPTADEVVALLGVDAAALPIAAAADVAAVQAGAGVDRASLSCVGCDAPGQVILIASTPLGHRWVDVCGGCFRWATARR